MVVYPFSLAGKNRANGLQSGAVISNNSFFGLLNGHLHFLNEAISPTCQNFITFVWHILCGRCQKVTLSCPKSS
jgi:hypothetical protein